MPNTVATDQQHHPMFRAAIAVLGLFAVVGMIGLLAEITRADGLGSQGSGTLVVDGNSYSFVPTTCFISDEEFVAAGTGYDRGQRFWVSASSVNLDLSVGTESAIDQPADDELWLISDELIDWQSTGQSVVARAPMSDRRLSDSQPIVGSLELHCDSAAIDGGA